MKKAKALAWFFIVAGVVALSYPVILKIQSNVEQKKMIKNFQSNKLKDVSAMENIHNKILYKPPVYTKWPETILIIPKLSVKVAVIEMDDVKIFEKKANCPPAHYKDTSFPGQKGNVAIAGHRNGPAGYFKNAKNLKKGDSIILETYYSSYEYIIEEVFVTRNDDWSVVKPLDYCGLTLTTCQADGIFSNTKRLIIRAKLKN